MDEDEYYFSTESEKDDKEKIASKESIDDLGLYSGELRVEKILGVKAIEEKDENGAHKEMYLIKWKGLSYLNVSWEYKGDLENVDPGAKSKLKKFAALTQPTDDNDINDSPKFTQVNLDADDIEYFNPEFVEVHRIISCNRMDCWHSKVKSASDLLNESNASTDIEYFIKWRGLPYDECTWENFETLKLYYSEEIFLFWMREKVCKYTILKHPEIKEYQKLIKSPVFGVKNPDSEDTNGGLTLRDYQLEGVNWLLWNWWHKRQCILADEMGLGKTIQSIAFLKQLRDLNATKVKGPFIVVAPLSLMKQWQSEVEIWAPEINCIILHGNHVARNNIFNHEFYYQNSSSKECKFDLLLTTYEIAIKELSVLSKIHWKVLIVDEAHRLKNSSSRLFEHLKKLKHDYCVLLTGTPLQNKTEELWALLNFADKNKFADQQIFLQQFGDLKDSSQVAKLHSALKPYLLRRIKEDVEKSLPPKEETIIEVALTPKQKQFYKAIYEKNTAILFKGTKPSNQPSLMNVMMELRKCCNHPYLVRGVEDKIVSEIPEETRTSRLISDKMIECCGKLVLLDKLLPRLFEQGHKVLIFSQMVKVLNILEDFMRYRGYLYERLDGSTKASDRNEAVERFWKPSLNRFIMLLSTKAGGLGLNLTSADTVIIYDSDWNPHNDLQAQARAHRIGQTKAVSVYRLITRKTYEMHMFHQASLKLGLDRAVLAHARNENENMIDAGDGKLILDVREIDNLLKRGAYDVFKEDDTEQNEFIESDIDAILQRQSHKVTYSDSKSQSASTLGSFSKASFVSSDDKEDVDINDPDFWKKVVGLTESDTGVIGDEDLAKMLSGLPIQRKRKQTAMYGGGNEIEIPIVVTNKPKDPQGFRIPKPPRPPRNKIRDKEPKIRAPPSDRKYDRTAPLHSWTASTRDRLLRLFGLYGIDRIEKICNTASSGLREVSDIKVFAQCYVQLCGSNCKLTDNEKRNFLYDFANVAIDDAKRKKIIETPPCLLERKFLERTIKLSKKTLVKFGIMNKLTDLMRKTFKTIAIATDNSNYNDSIDVDTAINLFTPLEIYEHMPLIDNRPAWCQITDWWNIECDKQLLLGIFIHGYGRFGTLMNNKNFCFHEYVKNNANDATLDQSDDSNITINMKMTNVNETASISCADSLLPNLLDDTFKTDDACIDDDFNDGVHDEDDEAEEVIELDIDNSAESSSISVQIDTTKSSNISDNKLLNKLLSWLVSYGVMGDKMLRRANMKKLKKKEEILSTSRLNDLIKMNENEILMNLNEVVDIEVLEKAKATTNLHSLKNPVKDVSLHSLISNDEINILAITFIQYGAPIDKFSNTLSWEQFRMKHSISTSVDVLRDYYASKWLPFCIQMCCMYKINNSCAHKHSIPNPFIPIGDHYTMSRGFCMLFFQRQKIMHSINYILGSCYETLVHYLYGSIGFSLSNSNMPIWWCPWKHDIDLLVGCARHGYLNISNIIKDTSLSFTFDKIKPILQGMISVFPVNFFIDNAEKENWIVAMAAIFPDAYQLEQRIILILQEVTASFDDAYLFKIIQGYSMPSLDDLFKGAPVIQSAIPSPHFNHDSVSKRKLYIESVYK